MAAGSKKVIYAALAGNGAIAVTKFIASAMTGSSAMLAEAIHSVVDTGNQVLLLWGLKRAGRPADEHFPLGHGKEVYFWSFVVAISIFGIGGGVSLYEGIKRLLNPHPVEHANISYIVLALAMVFEGFAWWYAYRGFKQSKGTRGFLDAVRGGKDPTMFVVLFEDTAAMLGLLVAFAGIGLAQLTGKTYFDGAASVVIGVILAVVAFFLAWETKGLLIGEAADPDVQKKIRDIAADHPGIKSLNELITLHMGPDRILVIMSLDFAAGLSSNDVETAATDINARIKKDVPYVARVFIEAESWSTHQRQRDAGSSTRQES